MDSAWYYIIQKQSHSKVCFNGVKIRILQIKKSLRIYTSQEDQNSVENGTKFSRT